MHPRKQIPRCANCKEHLRVESLSTPLSDADPQPGTANVGTPATVDYSGLAAHPVIAAMGDADTDEAKAAAVLRWLAADWDGDGCKCWRCIVDLADEVEAAGTDNTTRSATP